MATNTQTNVGLRSECGTLGMRNFENSGTVQYKCRKHNLYFMGSNYHIGDLLPFNVGSPATSYNKAARAQLTQYWDQGFILPAA